MLLENFDLDSNKFQRSENNTARAVATHDVKHAHCNNFFQRKKTGTMRVKERFSYFGQFHCLNGNSMDSL